MRARVWALVWFLLGIIVLNDEALGGIGIFDDDVDGMVLEDFRKRCVVGVEESAPMTGESRALANEMANCLLIILAERTEAGVYKSHLMQVVIKCRMSGNKLDSDPIIIPAGEKSCQILASRLGARAEGELRVLVFGVMPDMSTTLHNLSVDSVLDVGVREVAGGKIAGSSSCLRKRVGFFVALMARMSLDP